MPQLLIKQPDWCVVALTGDPVAITSDPDRPVRRAPDDAAGTLGPIVRRVPNIGNEYVLFCGPDSCRVNGEPVPLGIRVLRDRDEIVTAPGMRCFFSAEVCASIVPFAGGERAVFCPRCLLEIATGSPSVRCPVCGVAHHEDSSQQRPCWTYASCAACGHKSDLDAGLQWSPEEL